MTTTTWLLISFDVTRSGVGRLRRLPTITGRLIQDNSDATSGTDSRQCRHEAHDLVQWQECRSCVQGSGSTRQLLRQQWFIGITNHLVSLGAVGLFQVRSCDGPQDLREHPSRLQLGRRRSLRGLFLSSRVTDRSVPTKNKRVGSPGFGKHKTCAR